MTETKVKRLFQEKDLEFVAEVMGLSLTLVEDVFAASEPQKDSELTDRFDYVEYISEFYIHGLPIDETRTIFQDTKPERLQALLRIKG